MRLRERVHLVGSGELGFELTDPYDCHVYLVDGGGEYALIDSGVGRAPEAILAEMARDGLEPGRIRWILLTHGHADHAGGAAALQAAAPRATVLVPGHWRAALAAGDEDAIGLTGARAAGTYPSDYHLPPVRAGGEMADGQRIQVGDVVLTAIATPGHCAGHVALWAEGPGLAALFSGDLVLPGGRIVRLADSDMAQCAASVARVAALPVQALFGGHGRVALHRGSAHIAAADAAFRAGRIPPSIV